MTQFLDEAAKASDDVCNSIGDAIIIILMVWCASAGRVI